LYSGTYSGMLRIGHQ